MNIVLEGPDNSGKSTLAKILGEALGKNVYASEGPEKFPGELLNRVENYRTLAKAQGGVIFDRHPCISDIIYGSFRDRRSILNGAQENIFYSEQPLLIYCEPLSRGLNGHVEKKHDSRAHIAMVHEKYAAIHTMYQQWGLSRAHIIYRIGDDPARIIKFCRDFDPVQDVADFHRRFNQGYDGSPRILPPGLALFREDFQREETNEYINSARHAASLLQDFADNPETLSNTVERDIGSQLALMLDALCDMVYITLGTAHLHGFNFREAWRRVHAANMKKKPVAKRSESTRHSAFDIVKPEGWQPPDHTDLVKDHIHR